MILNNNNNRNVYMIQRGRLDGIDHHPANLKMDEIVAQIVVEIVVKNCCCC